MTESARWRPRRVGRGLWSASRLALGTTAQVVSDSRISAAELALVDQVLSAADQLASRFRPDSEISVLNSDPRREVEVSPHLAALLRSALGWARLTRGLLDPTVGAALVDAGYARDFDAMEKDQDGPVPERAAIPGWRLIDLKGRRLSRPPGVHLDLGATAKAEAADRAAGLLGSHRRGGFLVSLGGDLATAGPCPSGGWVIRVADDHRAGPGDPGQNLALTAGGLATSSVTVRRWRRQGREMHHLIDPRTGLPVSGPWRTVSVAAATCLQANALATAAVVAGDGARPLLDGAGVSARLVTAAGRVLHLGAWTSVGEELKPLLMPGTAA